RAIQSTAGARHPPRPNAAARLLHRLSAEDWRGAALGGCLLAPDGEALLIAREPAAAAGSVPVEAGGTALWDGRWRAQSQADERRRIGALGDAGVGVGDLIDADDDPAALRAAIPPAARGGLPAVWDEKGLRAVPALRWRRSGAAADVALTLAPSRPIATIWTAIGAGSLLGRAEGAHYVD
ncbi:MAG: hypothetical protein AAF684_08080, partial [Pseudomonadota bacterium]